MREVPDMLVASDADTIEKHLQDDCTVESVLADNAQRLQGVKVYNLPHILIDDTYVTGDGSPIYKKAVVPPRKKRCTTVYFFAE